MGGVDAKGVVKAYEKGQIIIYNTGIPIQLKPKVLYMECLDNPMYNYFFLVAEETSGIKAEDTNIEFCAALSNGEYVISDGIIYGKYEYDGDEDLPEGTILLERYTKGNFLFAFKMYGYNSINSTYDGRHNYATHEEFRKYMEVIAFTQNLYIRGDKETRNNLDKFYSYNIFNHSAKSALKEDVKIIEPVDELKAKNFVDECYADWDFSLCLEGYIQDCSDSPIKYFLEFNVFLDNLSSCYGLIFGPHKYLCKDGRIREAKDLQAIENEILYIKSRENCKKICKSCEEKLDKFSLNGLHKNYHFQKTFIRNQNVFPKHLFTKDEILTVIKNADDRHFNTLVIDENGYALMLQDIFEDRFLFPVRNSQWDAGNCYTGRHAILQDDYIDRIYIHCLTGWLYYLETGKHQYLSNFDVHDNKAMLLKAIKKFYK